MKILSTLQKVILVGAHGEEFLDHELIYSAVN